MYKKILVPLDGSELAECVLPHVEHIVKGGGVESVTFVSAAEPVHVSIRGSEGYTFTAEDWRQLESESRDASAKYLRQLVSRIKYVGVNIQTEVLVGRAADSIADYATKDAFDLITIATHGRSGVSRWVWGSVADKILRSACVPVLMIRAPGCVPGI
ncbi:universal stress protein [Chloroflexota bacterium]